jgi:hypothetical protein
MTIFDTQAEWIIVALIFILGLLIGAFLTAGGRRKWKARYREESAKRDAIEREHRDHVRQMEAREKEWAAGRTTAPSTHRDSDADGVPDRADRRPDDDSRA